MCKLNNVTNTAYTVGCKIKESVCDYPQGQAIFLVSLMPRLAHSSPSFFLLSSPLLSSPLLSSQVVPRTFSQNKSGLSGKELLTYSESVTTLQGCENAVLLINTIAFKYDQRGASLKIR